MIAFEDALTCIMQQPVTINSEAVDFMDALGWVLAEDVVADMDMPPFDKSAVDGYACRRADLQHELEVLETIAAGQVPAFETGPNQCSKIMTGAMIPKGADCVVMVEHCREITPGFIKFQGEKTADNICLTGEDVRMGDVVLKKGQLIKPQHIAVLAMVGCVNPAVSRQIRVGIISTGDELVEPDIRPQNAKIRNSNAWQLAAQCKAMNAIPQYMGIAPDEKQQTYALIMNALAHNDLILITGGVSMGDYDFVPEVLKEAGFHLHFKSIAMQPGRPTLFASNDDGKFCFGLPGNPVSSFNQFELLVKPLLYRMMGFDYRHTVLRLPLAVDYRRKKSERLSFLPVNLNSRGEIIPLEYHGSAHINALTTAFGLMSVPVGITEIKKGTLADVRPL